jgi:outer membrane receptor for ferrienterochelin and colicins
MHFLRLSLLILFCGTQWLFSQVPTEVALDSTAVENLNEVIISATRTKRELTSIPLPIQLISAKAIAAANSIRLNDILEEQTGLLMVSDFGGVQGLQMQGLDSQYNLILIDGVPLIGRSAGTLDLARVTVGNIKQIEIVKGPSSSLYGNEALAGIVNIITQTPKTGFTGRFYYRGGTFSSNDLNTELSYKKDKLGLYAFVNRFSNEGYDLVDSDDINTVEPFHNYTFNTKINYEFSEKVKLFVSGRLYHQVQDNVASANSYNGESQIDEWNFHSKLEFTFNESWHNQFEFYTTTYKAEEFLNDAADNLFSYSDFKQRFSRPEFRTVFKPNTHNSFIAGVGMQFESLQRTDFFENPKFNSSYLYSQYEYKKNDEFNLILGLRFDRHNEYASQLSPKAAVRYKFNDKLAVKGSVSYGFKTPDFRQLYFDFTNATVGYTVLGYNAVTTIIPELEANGDIANLLVPLSGFEGNLKPERSIGYNFGIDLEIDSKLKINLNLFRNEISNLIDTRVIARKTNGQNVFSYYNVNEIYTQGLELNANLKFNKNTVLTTGYQLLYAKDKKAIQAFKNGEVFARLTPTSPAFVLSKKDYFGLLNRSRHMLNFKLSYHIKKWNLDSNIRATYRSKFGLYDNNGNGYLDAYDTFVSGYSIFDFAINKTIFEHYKLGFGMDNFLDFNDPQNISNIAGRIVYGNVTINF